MKYLYVLLLLYIWPRRLQSAGQLPARLDHSRRIACFSKRATEIINKVCVAPSIVDAIMLRFEDSIGASAALLVTAGDSRLFHLTGLHHYH